MTGCLLNITTDNVYAVVRVCRTLQLSICQHSRNRGYQCRHDRKYAINTLQTAAFLYSLVLAVTLNVPSQRHSRLVSYRSLVRYYQNDATFTSQLVYEKHLTFPSSIVHRRWQHTCTKFTHCSFQQYGTHNCQTYAKVGLSGYELKSYL
jgi:hypothetical protein